MRELPVEPNRGSIPEFVAALAASDADGWPVFSGDNPAGLTDDFGESGLSCTPTHRAVSHDGPLGRFAASF